MTGAGEATIELRFGAGCANGMSCLGGADFDSRALVCSATVRGRSSASASTVSEALAGITAKASSASAFVTLWARSFVAGLLSEALGSNSNLLPVSWKSENSSSFGNLAESSSEGALNLLPSRAANGSLWFTSRKGDGLGLADPC